jgi:hypothetical protein
VKAWNNKIKNDVNWFYGMKITRFLLHNFQLRLLSIAFYYFISTLYMYSNWNYHNLQGKICRIEKNPIMISPYSILEVDKLLRVSCFRVLFGCSHTFEHPAYLNSGKNWCGSMYLLSFGSVHIILNFVISCFIPINYVV